MTEEERRCRLDRLHGLMARHKLTVEDIADKTGRSPWTVYQWLSRPGGGRPARPIPPDTLELLELKLQQP